MGVQGRCRQFDSLANWKPARWWSRRRVVWQRAEFSCPQLSTYSFRPSPWLPKVGTTRTPPFSGRSTEGASRQVKNREKVYVEAEGGGGCCIKFWGSSQLHPEDLGDLGQPEDFNPACPFPAPQFCFFLLDNEESGMYHLWGPLQPHQEQCQVWEDHPPRRKGEKKIQPEFATVFLPWGFTLSSWKSLSISNSYIFYGNCHLFSILSMLPGQMDSLWARSL